MNNERVIEWAIVAGVSIFLAIAGLTIFGIAGLVAVIGVGLGVVIGLSFGIRPTPAPQQASNDTGATSVIAARPAGQLNWLTDWLDNKNKELNKQDLISWLSLFRDYLITTRGNNSTLVEDVDKLRSQLEKQETEGELSDQVGRAKMLLEYSCEVAPVSPPDLETLEQQMRYVAQDKFYQWPVARFLVAILAAAAALSVGGVIVIGNQTVDIRDVAERAVVEIQENLKDAASVAKKKIEKTASDASTEIESERDDQIQVVRDLLTPKSVQLRLDEEVDKAVTAAAKGVEADIKAATDEVVRKFETETVPRIESNLRTTEYLEGRMANVSGEIVSLEKRVEPLAGAIKVVEDAKPRVFDQVSLILRESTTWLLLASIAIGISLLHTLISLFGWLSQKWPFFASKTDPSAAS